MTEKAGEYIRVPNMPEGFKESLSHGDLLWEDAETRMVYPNNPWVPKEEGIHIRVESHGVPVHPKTPDQWHAWCRHQAKMIGAAKVVSEGADLGDMWQSLVGASEYTPQDHLVTDIIGRNPKGKSWGATAPFPEPGYSNEGHRIEASRVGHLSRVLGRFMDTTWLPAMKTVGVFPNPVNISKPGNENYEKVFNRNTALEWPWQSEPLLVSDAAEVIAILVPHLKTGIHLMIGVPYAPKRPWHDVPKALEGLVTAEAVAQLLESNTYEGLPFAAATSIRATGSWFKGFTESMNDADFRHALEDGTMPRKWLKRRQKGIETQIGKGKEWTMGLGFHPHLYVARYPDELIRLAKRPATEGGPDWEGITVMDEKKRDAMRDLLNREFLRTIEAARGTISTHS